jgi:hypothetical protein
MTDDDESDERELRIAERIMSEIMERLWDPVEMRPAAIIDALIHFATAIALNDLGPTKARRYLVKAVDDWLAIAAAEIEQDRND